MNHFNGTSNHKMLLPRLLIIIPLLLVLILASCGGEGENDGEPTTEIPVAPSPALLTPILPTPTLAPPVISTQVPETPVVDSEGDAGLGTVTVLDNRCETGALPNTQCTRVQVTCPGILPIETSIRVTNPPSGVANRGTVVFGTGASGTDFFEEAETAETMLGDLARQGFQVIQRAWATSWEEGPGGFAAVSCRYATLITWVNEAIHQTGGFCVAGASGGASEIAYALAHWDRGDFIDLAVMSGGPPMARLDYGCLSDESGQWDLTCNEYLSASQCREQRLACTFDTRFNLLSIDSAYTPNNPCSSRDASQRQTLLADSVMAPGAVMNYPSTDLHFIFGERDCTVAAPLGFMYANAVTSEKSIEFVPGGHSVQRVPEGAAAYFDAILTGCFPRP